jgi:hypothetical protein
MHIVRVGSCAYASMDQWLVPVQKGLLLKHYRNLFSTVLAAHVFDSGISDSLTILSNRY